MLGVRVEDDGTRVEGNTFTVNTPAHRSVVVGTRARTARLGEPVTGTTVTGDATTAGNTTYGAEVPLGPAPSHRTTRS